MTQSLACSIALCGSALRIGASLARLPAGYVDSASIPQPASIVVEGAVLHAERRIVVAYEAISFGKSHLGRTCASPRRALVVDLGDEPTFGHSCEPDGSGDGFIGAFERSRFFNRLGELRCVDREPELVFDEPAERGLGDRGPLAPFVSITIATERSGMISTCVKKPCAAPVCDRTRTPLA